MFIAGASFNSCSDLLDTETLSTDNLNYLCSNATDARKMVDHVYAYFCEDTYTSRMSTNWMQNTDVEIGFVKKAQATETTRRGIWALNPSYFGDIKNCWNNKFIFRPALICKSSNCKRSVFILCILVKSNFNILSTTA